MADKPLFDKFFKQHYTENAHFNFTNLFMWRKAYAIKWTIDDEFLCIRASWEDSYFLLPPFGPDGADMSKVLEHLLAHFDENNWPFVMRGVEAPMMEEVIRIKPDYFEVIAERDNYDYVYNTSDLVELKGRKFHAKKNHANNFRKSHADYIYTTLTAGNASLCIDMLIEWCEKRDCDSDGSLECEKEAIIIALENFTALGFSGGLIMLDGKVEAFTFGEQLNPDMAVIHVEKANPDIRGVYAVVNQEFCRENWQHLTFINREEDMGLEGLRKAKESYNPVKMIEKYIIKR